MRGGGTGEGEWERFQVRSLTLWGGEEREGGEERVWGMSSSRQVGGGGATTSSSSGGESQVVCDGCSTVLLYPRASARVRCAVCDTVTHVDGRRGGVSGPSSGGGPGWQAGPSDTRASMSQLVCGACRTLLLYPRGATTVQCSMCNTVNLAVQQSQVSQINCSSCNLTLMYAFGAASVKCANCDAITNTGAPGAPGGPPRRVTVLIENPPSLDANGDIVRNVAVGTKETRRGSSHS